jgi:hypothetical protein
MQCKHEHLVQLTHLGLRSERVVGRHSFRIVDGEQQVDVRQLHNAQRRRKGQVRCMRSAQPQGQAQRRTSR